MKIKIGILGCGRISDSHIAALKSLPEIFELVGLADIDSQRLHSAHSKHSIPASNSLDEMIEKFSPEVVSLCTPSGLHSIQGIHAASRGVHIITEKPLATTYDDGLRLVQYCEQVNRKLFVVKQNRLNPTVQMLKNAIDKGRFGRLYSIATNVFWTRPQEYYDQDSWRGTWALDGGAFMNQASHYIDLITWLMGGLESLTSYNATLSRKIEAEDSGVMSLRFRNGALGTLNVSMLTFPKNYEGSITILGEKGLVKLGGVALNKIEAWQFEDHREEDDTVFSKSYETSSVYGFGHALFYAEVGKAIRGMPNIATTGRDGLQSLSTLIAAYRSAKNNGSPVGLPLNI